MESGKPWKGARIKWMKPVAEGSKKDQGGWDKCSFLFQEPGSRGHGRASSRQMLGRDRIKEEKFS